MLKRLQRRERHIRTVFERFKTMAIAALAGIALLLWAYLRGRGQGRRVEQAQRDASINRQAEDARQEARNVQDQTARMDDAAIGDELKRDWVRGAGPRRR
ncbi:hypothetical protein [Achromobacter piechaudii]|uniref:hypothetical protein n=1 Tax=Achromobacter piechaudii TaxID=72556 RepID=UPI001FD189B8|nr:hypothetical protein [Achromobacter piechaudii]